MLRVANCSGFYGDRLSAAREMVEGGPIDVLTGDWLAELTLLILARDRLKNPGGGWARTFLTQMEEVLGECVDRDIRVVSNAGGLDPRACAEAVQDLADRLGLEVPVAYVTGDDLSGRLEELRQAGVRLVNIDTGEDFADLGLEAVAANAYLGCWGIVEALRRGARVVVCGRVTDASLVVGPAAWHHGWRRDDWDRLAGAVAAGHVIECGAQCTGGNYAFFEEVPDLRRPGFPVAEIHEDGSAVITKHPGTGGAVTVGTVTAQLLYEIQGPRYLNPDVVARFDTLTLTQQGPDRVLISGARGEPPPDKVKVAINYVGGWRNTMTLVITGLEVERKAEVALEALWSSIPGGRDAFERVDVQMLRCDRPDPRTNEEAVSLLRVTVADRDRQKVSRAFSNRVVELMLSNYPGFFTTTPPTEAAQFGVYFPTAVPADFPRHEVVIGQERIAIPPTPGRPTPPDEPTHSRDRRAGGATDEHQTVRAPLGLVAGARSGDKGGNANVGVWARDPEAWEWLRLYLTVDRLQDLLPEARELTVRRYEFENLRALNFVIEGLLGRGVAASTRLDPQAKGLGEYLRAKYVDIPARLLSDESRGALS